MKKIKNLLFVLLVATICCLSAMLVACSTRSEADRKIRITLIIRKRYSKLLVLI